MRWQTAIPESWIQVRVTVFKQVYTERGILVHAGGKFNIALSSGTAGSKASSENRFSLCVSVSLSLPLSISLPSTPLSLSSFSSLSTLRLSPFYLLSCLPLLSLCSLSLSPLSPQLFDPLFMFWLWLILDLSSPSVYRLSSFGRGGSYHILSIPRP